MPTATSSNASAGITPEMRAALMFIRPVSRGTITGSWGGTAMMVPFTAMSDGTKRLGEPSFVAPPGR